MRNEEAGDMLCAQAYLEAVSKSCGVSLFIIELLGEDEWTLSAWPVRWRFPYFEHLHHTANKLPLGSIKNSFGQCGANHLGFYQK